MLVFHGVWGLIQHSVGGGKAPNDHRLEAVSAQLFPRLPVFLKTDDISPYRWNPKSSFLDHNMAPVSIKKHLSAYCLCLTLVLKNHHSNCVEGSVFTPTVACNIGCVVLQIAVLIHISRLAKQMVPLPSMYDIYLPIFTYIYHLPNPPKKSG